MDEVAIKLKNWYKSATLWLQGFIVTIATLGDMLPISQYMPESPVFRWLVGGIAAATIYLRLFATNQAITVTAALKPVDTDKVIPAEKVAELKAK